MIAVLGSLFSPARVRRAASVLRAAIPRAARAIRALTPPIRRLRYSTGTGRAVRVNRRTARSDRVVWYTLSFGLSWLELGHASVDG